MNKTVTIIKGGFFAKDLSVLSIIEFFFTDFTLLPVKPKFIITRLLCHQYSVYCEKLKKKR